MPPSIDLVFSGGGTGGVALAGAAEVLETHRPVIRRMLGTSAGAVAAVFGAAGIPGRDYLKLVPSRPGDPFLFNAFFVPPEGEAVRELARKKDSETRKVMRAAVDSAIDKYLEGVAHRRPRIGEMMQNAFALGKQPLYESAFERFLERLAGRDVDPQDPRKMTFFISLLETGGLFDPEVFRLWLVKQLRARLPAFDKTTTLKEFHEATIGDVGRELSVVATDTTEARPLVLNHRTAPKCPVAEAVLMSLSVPFIWPESTWRKEWGAYLGHDIDGHAVVDGAVLANFPLQYLLNRDREDVRRILGEPDREPPAIVGLYLDASLPVPGDVAPAPNIELKLLQRAERLMSTMSAWQWESVRAGEDWICRIGTKGHPALELAHTPDAIQRLQALVNSGRCAMTEHLKKRKLFG
jgi:predicted acylesterase/phospholipase RssA